MDVERGGHLYIYGYNLLPLMSCGKNILSLSMVFIEVARSPKNQNIRVLSGPNICPWRVSNKILPISFFFTGASKQKKHAVSGR